MDAMIMDRLTASPHVIDAYGFCGQSVLTEWAPTGGREHVKSYDLKNRQRLKVARDLAQGLADLQALRPLSSPDYTSHDHGKENKLPVFAHNDINIANTVQVDGQIKWNDFNIGVLLRTQNTNATEMCGSPVRFQADLWRSPEEIRNTSYVRLEQTDVYGFGNILYQTMTRHQPWTHKEPEGSLSVADVAARKRLGRLPTIPEQYKNTTKPELQALLLATMSCYHPNPDKRPTAYELAKGLSLVYDRLSHKKKVTPIFLRDLFVKQ
jgi:serine/threonine protein kinase